MKIALFLGAGASVPFGKPTTLQLKQNLIEKYPYSSEPTYLSSFLRCDKFNDIEHVLQSLRDIQWFANSYGYKFFSDVGYGLYLHRGGDPIELQDFIKKEAVKIEKIIENDVFENYAWDNSKDELLSRIYDKIFQALEKHSEKLMVFTTNYDRAIEEYCSQKTNKYSCVDGFKLDKDSNRFLWAGGDFSYFDDDKTVTNIYLYKLHGSLNWKMHTKYKIERTTEERKPTDSNYVASILIYPTMSPKDGHEKEPFMTIQNNFEQHMQEADACIVIGFSFRDQHVNDIFRNLIKNKKAFIAISPSSVDNICINLLGEPVPEYDKGRANVMPSPKYENVWCLPHPIQAEDAEITMNLAITLIDSVLKKYRN